MKLIFTVIIVYVAIVAAMGLFQRKLMYFPATDLLAPAQYGLKDTAAGKLTTADGETLDYWYAAAKDNAPTILLFHGNGGHIGYRSNYVQAAQQYGFGVMLVSYRGYGTSSGSPTERGLYLDADAAYRHLTTQLNIANEQLIIFGESLGTGVAVELARGKKFRALVLQAPFTSALSIAQKVYWWLPVKWVMKDRFESIAKVQDIKAPTLVLGAEHDYVTTLAEAEALFEALPEPKKIIVYKGIGHNGFNPSQIMQELKTFIE